MNGPDAIARVFAPPRLRWVPAAALAAASAGSVCGAGESANFLLVRRDRPVQFVEVAEIGEQRVVLRESGSAWQTIPRDQCVALLNRDLTVPPQLTSWLRLADGQVFPGEALSSARRSDEVLVWNQSSGPWLGRMEVPLERIDAVAFGRGSVPPPGDMDVLLLANGDRLEGVVTALGDPVTVDVFNGGDEGVQSIQLPLDRVVAVRMVTPPQKPAGVRLWLIDGTVVDVDEVLLGDDGVYRVHGRPFVADEGEESIQKAGVAAVLFDQEALVPFARLSPVRVEGPSTRYVVPGPEVIDAAVPLGLLQVAFRGPVSVRYLLPKGAAYLAAVAELPPEARSWGDCELVIRNDDRVVFSSRLNAEHPDAAVAVPLASSILTIEIREGAAGPIQDHVVLTRALLLK